MSRMIEGWPWPEDDDHAEWLANLVLGLKVAACVPVCVLAWGIAIPAELLRAGCNYTRHVVCRALDPARWL